MRLLVTLLASALGAFATATWTPQDGPVRTAGPGADVAADLRGEIADLRSTLAEQTRRLDARAGAYTPSAPAAGPVIQETEIAASVARWQAAHPAPEPDRSGTPERVPHLQAVELPLDVADLSIPEVIRLLEQDALTADQRQQLFEELRAAGRIDDYVAEIERLAEADPANPALRVALGNAYLQKLFGVKGGPEAGTWAMKSDAAFGQALELDPENWEARFLKAISLSNWPAFLGKGREAMDHFEVLVEQQESMAPRPEFAQTYLFYGNVLAANGDPGEALAVWRRGLSLFPDVRELREAIANAEREQD